MVPTGKSSQRPESNNSPLRSIETSGGAAAARPRALRWLGLSWLEAAFLLGSGILVVVLHQVLRMPLGLPGRHGIEWMAILVIVRCSSDFQGAGSLSMVGAAATSMLPVWRSDDPFLWIVYLVPGIVIDLLWHVVPKAKNKVWIAAALLIPAAALAHFTKPLIRWIISLIAGWPYGSFRYGVAYPMYTHILFGLAGGVIGVALFFGWKRGRLSLSKRRKT